MVTATRLPVNDDSWPSNRNQKSTICNQACPCIENQVNVFRWCCPNHNLQFRACSTKLICITFGFDFSALRDSSSLLLHSSMLSRLLFISTTYGYVQL